MTLLLHANRQAVALFWHGRQCAGSSINIKQWHDTADRKNRDKTGRYLWQKGCRHDRQQNKNTCLADRTVGQVWIFIFETGGAGHCMRA